MFMLNKISESESESEQQIPVDHSTLYVVLQHHMH